MLKIETPETELWDEYNQRFILVKKQTLFLEHSLISLSRWESNWEKPFLKRNDKKTLVETIDYVRCMTINNNVDPNVYRVLTADNINAINAYVNAKKTATIVYEDKHRSTGETVTSELIYYWMVSLGIPFECQKWHLNRLLTLIRVCNVKNSPGKKMGRNALLNRYASLNKKRREAMHSNG
mgnify:FL=1|jgi:hypothetical protein